VHARCSSHRSGRGSFQLIIREYDTVFCSKLQEVCVFIAVVRWLRIALPLTSSNSEPELHRKGCDGKRAGAPRGIERSCTTRKWAVSRASYPRAARCTTAPAISPSIQLRKSGCARLSRALTMEMRSPPRTAV